MFKLCEKIKIDGAPFYDSLNAKVEVKSSTLNFCDRKLKKM